MDAEDTAKKEIIDQIKSLMISPNVKLSEQSDEDENKFSKFISSVKFNKESTVDLPLEFALRSEMFELIRTKKVFINSSICFKSTFTTKRPDLDSSSEFKAAYHNHEFDYLFLDNHPGIINVNNLKDIPSDYEGLMAVPVTVLLYKNINRFNIHRIIYDPVFIGRHIYSRVVVSNKTTA